MFQLILHHVYRKGPYPIDISGAENDGIASAVGYIDDGIAAGSGALLFKSPYARVRVPWKPIWQHLLALRVEVVTRIDAVGARRNLVEGADSFAFAVDDLGRPWGAFNGPQLKGGPPGWHGASAATHSPDGIVRTVPIGKWVTLRYEHDGYASLRIYMDGVLVAANYYALVSGVPGVTGAGVNIGNWTIADQYQLNGAIDEVKIWRRDADDSFGHFLCRELSKDSGRCWALFFDWLAAQLRNSDARPRVLRLMRCIASAQEEALRRIRAQGERAIEENRRLAEEYRKLWCDGPIDGQAMLEWQQRFMKFLLKTIGREGLDELINQVRLCYLRGDLQDYLPKDFDPSYCDPAFAGYIQGFSAAFGGQYGLIGRS